MIKYDTGYEALINALSEYIGGSGKGKIVPLASLVLPSTVFEQIKKNYDLLSFSNIAKKSCSFSLEDVQQASSKNYDIELTVPLVNSNRKTISIIVSDIENTDTLDVYKSYDEHNYEYTYGFVKKNKNGILLFYVSINLQTYLTKIDIKAFDKETTDFIGKGYLVPELLLKSYKYGVEPDYSEKVEEYKLYLADVLDLFNKKADEILSDSATLNKKKF